MPLIAMLCIFFHSAQATKSQDRRSNWTFLGQLPRESHTPSLTVLWRLHRCMKNGFLKRHWHGYQREQNGQKTLTPKDTLFLVLTHYVNLIQSFHCAESFVFVLFHPSMTQFVLKRSVETFRICFIEESSRCTFVGQLRCWGNAFYTLSNLLTPPHITQCFLTTKHEQIKQILFRLLCPLILR